MKNLIFTLLLVCGLAQLAAAQSPSAFEVTPNPSDTITTMDTYDSPAHGHIHNVSNAPITVRWERNIISLSPNIETAVCDPIQCWFPSVGTKTFTLNANEGGQMTVHFYNATGGAASGIVHVKLTNLGNPSDTLTAVYTWSTLTGTNDLPLANVKLFPNPTTEYFTLENADEVASMRLFTLDGREVARFNASPDHIYSIANQPLGNYVLSFEDKNGQLFQAVEIQKR
ncbi:MAG: T9SS type A sorting domain-containing protein [Saprospiraceae bacterium]|nr:T9SS type A sorting domain-containing protein [Saprospiraceae bacterium]